VHISVNLAQFISDFLQIAMNFYSLWERDLEFLDAMAPLCAVMQPRQTITIAVTYLSKLCPRPRTDALSQKQYFKQLNTPIDVDVDAS
jgi:hypothetical protein